MVCARSGTPLPVPRMTSLGSSHEPSIAPSLKRSTFCDKLSDDPPKPMTTTTVGKAFLSDLDDEPPVTAAFNGGISLSTTARCRNCFESMNQEEVRAIQVDTSHEVDERALESSWPLVRLHPFEKLTAAELPSEKPQTNHRGDLVNRYKRSISRCRPCVRHTSVGRYGVNNEENLSCLCCLIQTPRPPAKQQKIGRQKLIKQDLVSDQGLGLELHCPEMSESFELPPSGEPRLKEPRSFPTVEAIEQTHPYRRKLSRYQSVDRGRVASQRRMHRSAMHSRTAAGKSSVFNSLQQQLAFKVARGTTSHRAHDPKASFVLSRRADLLFECSRRRSDRYRTEEHSIRTAARCRPRLMVSSSNRSAGHAKVPRQVDRARHPSQSAERHLSPELTNQPNGIIPGDPATSRDVRLKKPGRDRSARKARNERSRSKTSRQRRSGRDHSGGLNDLEETERVPSPSSHLRDANARQTLQEARDCDQAIDTVQERLEERLANVADDGVDSVEICGGVDAPLRSDCVALSLQEILQVSDAAVSRTAQDGDQNHNTNNTSNTNNNNNGEASNGQSDTSGSHETTKKSETDSTTAQTPATGQSPSKEKTVGVGKIIEARLKDTLQLSDQEQALKRSIEEAIFTNPVRYELPREVASGNPLRKSSSSEDDSSDSETQPEIQKPPVPPPKLKTKFGKALASARTEKVDGKRKHSQDKLDDCGSPPKVKVLVLRRSGEEMTEAQKAHEYRDRLLGSGPMAGPSGPRQDPKAPSPCGSTPHGKKKLAVQATDRNKK